MDIREVTEERLMALQKEIPAIDERDIQECLPPQQRPKYVDRGEYQFAVLLFPRYLRNEHAIVTEEVDIFFFNDTVITVHNNALPIFEELEDDRDNNPERVDMTKDSAHLLLEILERLLDYCNPILVHLQNDIDKQERLVRRHFDEVEIISTSLLRRNVVAFRRAFAPNAHALEHLRAQLAKGMPKRVQVRFNRVIDKTSEVLLLLGDYASAINDIHETQQALVQYRTNRVTTTLSVIAVLTFPPALIAAVIDIGAPGTPLVNHPYGFILIAGMLAFISISMLTFFKLRRWF
jgi:magnesium transporter